MDLTLIEYGDTEFSNDARQVDQSSAFYNQLDDFWGDWLSEAD